ncbi:unnamed protein product [Dovyalis caffra]|uniref:Amino acid transporter transmembrane domain-containing protein n=1 Tax=Dovyalis caffra TaxID=77055 RepID=A0AAV1QUS5_9ROSI|nr:unnamed protein product [Dovyalis caffra]
MGAEAGEEEAPLLHPTLPSNSTIKRTGTIWTGVAHIIAGVIGSGILSLSWSMAQLGWIAGPLAMLFFASITLLSTFLLCDCYRSPHPEFSLTRNRSFLEAVHQTLGIAYTVTTSLSLRAIQKSNCFHKEGHDASCEQGGGTLYMLLFGAVQVILSQIPDFHHILWLSIFAAIMSVSYSSIGSALGFAQVIENGYFKGDIGGVPAYSAVEKDTLKSPPSENKTMKTASTIAVIATTTFYLCCGGFGYAAFGENTLGNLLRGFDFSEPYWLVDLANACIVLHLVGGYQVFTQPLFANIERWIAKNYPNSRVIDSVRGRLLLIKKPDPTNAAGSARWLVSQNSWGVLNTISSDLGGAPFGNVVSFSDGPPGKGRGIPYFYLTTLDPTAKNALQDQRSSFTISEYSLGTCGKKDPENPSCAKITLTGKNKG